MASKSGSQSCDQSTSSGEPTEVQASEPVHQEYDFVEEPPREYFCPVTFELLSDPKQTKCCGHLLSGKVVSRLQREGKSCPLCNDPNFTVTEDKYFKRKANELKVRCPHECEWVGELGNLDQHSNSCPKRPWQCQHCDFKGTYDIGTTDHLPNCTKYPEPCPNQCEIGTVPRCDMEKHLTQCPLQLVECEFAQAGCQVRVPRQDLVRHMEEGSQRHLLNMSLLNLSLTRDLHKKMAKKDQQIAELQEQMQHQSSKLEKQIKDLQLQCKRIEKKIQPQLESELQHEIQGKYCGTYTFESVQFPGVYLRMDGNGVTKSVGPGGGTVNCQFGADAWEEFKVNYHANSCNYSIESATFPGAYLRMDGNGVTEFVDPGGGVVNCQFGVGPWEMFKLNHVGSCNSSTESVQFLGACLPGGTYTLESVQFPGVYLRMDGNGVTECVGPGGGTVNCQFGAGAWEEFKLTCINSYNSDSCNSSVDSYNSSIESVQLPGAYLPSGTYTLESVQFPGVYLRMDGNVVTKFVGPGGGVVNCQFGADAWEEFKLNYHANSCNYSIESATFHGAYLRMDGNGVTEFVDPGGGVVNCQFGAGPWEMFKLNHVGGCNFSIESAQFPGVYLRMDGNGVTESVGPGGGVVNCQFGAGAWEEFKLSRVDSHHCHYPIESVQFPGAYFPSGTYTFESVQFPGVYLRMDGNGVTEPVGPGGGVVNCQFGASTWEEFKLNHIDSCNYSIESAQFPGTYLRMDGNGVTESVGSGAGVVNCQFGAGAWEIFKLVYNGADYSFSIQSVQFPGVYLRMDGNGVTAFSAPGAGVVNCQFGAGPYEKFKLKSAQISSRSQRSTW